ncbi:MAG: ThuA domain-containing protein, partial [Chitinophagaceae bacterium]
MKDIFRRLVAFWFVFQLVFCSYTNAQQKVNWENVRVLVYTKNGEGYVHDNISSAVNSIQKLG